MRRVFLIVVLMAVILTSSPLAGASLPLILPACGAVVTTSFRLADDMNCPGSNGIVVGAPGITVHLNGFTVTGDGTNSGVLNQGHDDVTVKGGTLRAFFDGFKGTAGPKRNKIIGVVAVDNANDGIEFDVDGNGQGGGHLISKSVATGNDDEGIEVDGKNIEIRNCDSSNNQVQGFDLGLVDSVVTGNRASGNGGSGVSQVGSKTTLQGNDLSGNEDFGLRISGDKNRALFNRAHGNELDGVHIASGAANVIKRNHTHGNGYVGGVSDGLGSGIDATADAAVKGGGNKARGNDNPNQCVGISCGS